MATKIVEAFEPVDALLDDENFTSGDEVREAIAAFFYESPSRIDVRPLWDTGSGRFCRVNFWGNDPETGAQRISRSKFVMVEDGRNGLLVTDMTYRRVA